MSRRTAIRAAALAVVVLSILHVDFWRPSTGALWLGCVPEDLAYRIAWMIAAWGVMLFITAFVWRAEAEEG